MGARIPLQIPHNWKVELLDNLAKRGSGHTPDKSKAHYYNGGIKWVSLADSSALDCGYIFSTKKEISEDGVNNSSAVIHSAETVILSRDAGVGKSAVLSEPMAVSQHFIAWECDNTKKLVSWFLYYWLQFRKEEFERQAVGSTIKTIGLPYFKKLKIVTPPFKEQQKIAKILSTWDKAIEKLEALILAKQQRKKALMQQLFSQSVRFKDEEGNDYPDWEIKKLEDVFDCKKGQGLSKNKIEENGKFKCVLYGELYTKYSEVIKSVVSKTNSSEGFKSKKCDILIPSSTTTTGIDLANATELQDDNVLLGGDISILRFKDNISGNSSFYSYYLTHFKKYEMSRYAQGITIIHLYFNHFKAIDIVFPELEEQQKIAVVLSAADKEIEQNQQQLTTLKQQKKGLMQQLLTGKKRVKLDATEIEA